MHGTCNSSILPAVSLRRSSPSWSLALARVLDTLLLWHERIKSRRVLATLDERMLRDIGIDQASAEREASTPFWR
jgi:uncharacterized protein YjiS (DUF1127 family)